MLENASPAKEEKINLPRYIIGLMSGSSMDGLDLAYCFLDGPADRISWDIIKAETIQYPLPLVDRLKSWRKCTAEEYIVLEKDFSLFVAKTVANFITSHCHEVDLIVSHGHTLFHKPEEGISIQIGNGGIIAAKTGFPVLCDLRIQDVSLGGEGAPLAALTDQFLFSQYDYAINIGGIANVSMATSEGNKAFDICAANQVLNFLAQKKGKDFDENGELSRSGKLIPNFKTVIENEYYSRKAPKSLDNHWVETEVIQALPNAEVNDLLHSYVHFIAEEVFSAVINEDKEHENKNMLMCGGGVRNEFLVETIQNRLATINVRAYEGNEELIDFKEALLMALMGHLYILGADNVLCEVTGAEKSSIAGALYQGSKQELQWIKVEE